EWPSTEPLRSMRTGADTWHPYPSAKLPFISVNNYGPTDCTVVATSGVINPEECTEQQPPIGKPIANTQVHIVDEHMRPMPTGTPGEIYIGGACVARGYRNRSALTHQKFVRNPFSDSPEARLYKTGDRGRYLPTGEIEFLGRIDDQIK